MKTNPTRQEVLRALADGLTVEHAQGISHGILGPWRSDLTSSDMAELLERAFCPEFWRILDPPAPKRLVPLGPEDVPPGSIVRRQNRPEEDTHWIAVTAVSDALIWIGNQSIGWLGFQLWEISRDGGRSWQRAEKEEA